MGMTRIGQILMRFFGIWVNVPKVILSNASTTARDILDITALGLLLWNKLTIAEYPPTILQELKVSFGINVGNVGKLLA